MTHTPAILTRSGLLFDLQEPKPHLVNLTDITFALANIPRFTGHTRTRWTVAQHLLTCHHIASHCDLGTPPDSPLPLYTVIHDAAEAYIGDVSSPLKGLVPAFKEVERRVEAAILQRLDLPEPEDGIRGSVKLIDMISYVAEREFLMPHVDFEKHGHSDAHVFQDVIKYYREEIETGKRFIARSLFGKNIQSHGELAKRLNAAITIELKRYKGQ